MPRNHKKKNKKPHDASKKPPLTHFLCIPLVNATSKTQLEDSLNKFKNDVCQGPHVQGSVISPSEDQSLEPDAAVPDQVSADTPRPSNPTKIPEKAVRPLGVLHLTLGVMSLDGPGLASAVSLLETTNINALLTHEESETKPASPTGPSSTHVSSPEAPPLATSSSETSPLEVSLTGLVSMHPPHKTSILYISPIDPSSRLQSFAEALRNRFMDAGLLIEDTRPLKLHATVVNTIYAKGRKSGGRGKGKGKVKTNDSHNKAVDGANPSQLNPLQPEERSTENPTENVTTESSRIETKEIDTSQGHGANAKAPFRLDMRDVLERYKDFVWADHVLLDRVAICEMGAKKTVDEKGEVVSEEYREVARVGLPGHLG